MAVMLAALISPKLLAQDYQPPAQQTWSERSPDGRFEATQRIMPDPDRLWDRDMDTARLVVRTMNGTYVAFHIPRLMAQIKWSPDSRYIVMTTVSAGGHSPWHFCAFVYSVTDGTLRYMDDSIGLVVAPDFKFVGSHEVAMKIGTDGSDGVDFEHPKSVMIDLDKTVARMEKQSGRSQGNIGG
jgi:hypothetical protein